MKPFRDAGKDISVEQPWLVRVSPHLLVEEPLAVEITLI
jgi:hypothetical protein